MDPAILTLAVLGVAALFFATEIIPLAVTAMGAAIALGLLGVLTPKEVFSGLSNSTVVLFAGMFVIGAAMFQTGLAQWIGIAVVKKSGTNERALMIALMTITIVLSSVSSNTATVACLMPVVVQICAAAKIPVSPQLMALAVAANVGGTITMIGTPPNILMSATLQASGLQPFGFFEFAWIGIPLSIVGILYMLSIGYKLCPRHEVKVEGEAKTEEGPKDKKKMMVCLAILLCVIVAMVLEKDINVPMQTSAIIGALACVLTGCLTEKQAYRGIDWTTIFLFAGMLPLANAMESSGAGQLIANVVVGLMGDAHHHGDVHPLVRADPVHVQHGGGGTPRPHRHLHRADHRRGAVPDRYGHRHRRLLRVHHTGRDPAEHARPWSRPVPLHGLRQGWSPTGLCFADHLPCHHPARLAVLTRQNCIEKAAA